jgi:hypothetical protein
MSQLINCRVIALFAIAFVTAIVAVAQSSTPLKTFESQSPVSSASAGDNWQAALRVGSTKDKLVVVTVDKPNRGQSCHLLSFTPDQLVCSRPHSRRRTYRSQQVAALILPGNGGLKLWMALLGNGVMGAATWGTVVLAATCPVCAVLTGLDAASAFVGAWVVPFGIDQPDRLLYLAPGQHLSRKFRHVKS